MIARAGLALRRLFALVVLALVLPSGAWAAEDGARVVLVLDASGSMWSRIGNQTKIEIARDTVGTILKDWRPQDQLGLVVYGHRRKGDCGDIEVVKPVGPVDPAALMATVGAISPKGRTPMTQAVRVAADQLAGVEGPASVILVSDGLETCQADPCAVAAELKARDIGLTVHTVGFDIQDPDATNQLACMAEKTGGLALTAANAGELVAAIQKAVAVAQAPAAPAPPPAPSPPKEEPQPEWNLTGSVRLSADDDPLVGKEGISWAFYKPAPAGVEPEHVDTVYEPDIRARLEPGDYVAAVEVGAVKFRQQVTIAAGRMNRLDVVLNAGRLGLRAKRTESVTAQGDVVWKVSRKGVDEAIYTAYDPETSTVIPAGEYSVELTLGAAKLTRDVEIAPGDTTAVEIVAGVGRLKGRVTFSPGGPAVKDPHVEILPGAQPVEDEKSVADAYAGEPQFDLPAGSYRARVSVDGVNRSFPFEIRPGDSLDLVLPIDAGVAAFEAPGADSVKILASGEDIYGDQSNDLTTLYTLPGSYVLPVGRYKAVAVKGDAKVEAEFEVTAGKRTVTTLQVP
ncbi:vWA domain-containing protein [Labrys wisconsinensis]|uniref:Ca-activated chloride channel family protein n=1 Tax=Labrys wisconsinensis TaxID=425677 RepID=A0ABU0JHQ3_9HYPH|nr:VWA domain-containing protein [Labrys wisconsinensis]MDQ0473130.1 Ca-activated chloride channel family protein [Labrys wisconsinensis]